MIVYKATNKINGKVYIGQTVYTLEKRKKEHEKAGKYKYCNGIFDKAIQKYGKENFDWEIIDTAKSIDELNKKESYYILLYHATDLSLGYNLKNTGENSFLSDDTKKKIGDAQRGELNHMFGKTGKDNPQSKRIKNITDDILYDSINECARCEKVNFSHLAAVCRGNRVSHNGKVYRFINENGEIVTPENPASIKAKRIRNVETGEIFYTMIEAAKKYGINKANLSKACKKGSRSGGFHWEYC